MRQVRQHRKSVAGIPVFDRCGLLQLDSDESVHQHIRSSDAHSQKSCEVFGHAGWHDLCLFKSLSVVEFQTFLSKCGGLSESFIMWLISLVFDKICDVILCMTARKAAQSTEPERVIGGGPKKNSKVVHGI